MTRVETPASRSAPRPIRSGTAQRRRSRPVAAWFGVALLRAVAWLPFPVIYRLAGFAGRHAARLPARPARFAAVTIRTCFPAWSDGARRDLLRDTLAEGARMIAELGPFWTWPRARVLALVGDIDGAEHLDAALSGGRGAILLTPHIGAWELAGLYCSAMFPITVLYKPGAGTALDRFVARGRTRFGAKLAPATPAGLRMLARALARREAVGILPDHQPRRGSGVFAPFFGVPAHTTTVVWRLARRSGAPVLLTFAERLKDGQGFRMHIRQVSPDVHDADNVVSAAALNLEIERVVRAHPEQYLWSYKRFRIRPPGEANPYRPVTHARTLTC